MSLQIIGGFIAVLGIAVIAIALTVNWLFGTSGPSVPAEGFVALFLGFGLFAAGRSVPPAVDVNKKVDEVVPADENAPVAGPVAA